jgi:hypothetical protein
MDEGPMNERPFDAASAARRLMRLATAGSLATLTDDGAPFASLVTVATTAAGEPILLLSALAAHSRNLAGDARASLLLVGRGGEEGDPLAGARLTLVGRAQPGGGDAALRRRFLARHPAAAGYADFADFGFFRFVVAGGHLVAGFGRIVALTVDDLLTDLTGADDLMAAEEDAMRHMNEDHVDEVALMATRLEAAPAGEWRLTGIDPEGIDLAAGTERARLDFPRRLTTAADLRGVLAVMTQKARATPAK